MYSGQSGCIWVKWLYSVKLVVFGQSGCIREVVVVFGKGGCIPFQWLYSGKSGCIRENEEIFVQSFYIRAKVVEFWQEWLCSGKNGFIREKVAVIEQSGCIRAKLIVYGQSGCI